MSYASALSLGRFRYNMTITFAPGEFRRIQQLELRDGQYLLPQDINITMITIDVVAAQMTVKYYGRNKNGELSKRSSTVYLDVRAWMSKLIPDDIEPELHQAIALLWPEPIRPVRATR